MTQKILLVLLGVVIGAIVTFSLSSNNTVSMAELEKLPEPYYTVLWENEDLRIVEHRIPVDDSEPRHSHPEMLAYFMENCSVQITEADGTVHDESLTKGQFREVPPWTHSIKNIGDTPLHTLLVELKSGTE